MTKKLESLSRRDFLKLGGCAFASIPLSKLPESWQDLGKIKEVIKLLEDNNLEYLPDRTIETEGRFRPARPITTFNFPLRPDYTHDSLGKVSIFDLPAQANFSYRNMYFCRDRSAPEADQIQRLTILPNTMGSHSLVIARLDSGKFNGTRFQSSQPEHPGITRSLSNILGETSYVVGDGRIYPNKILNLLTAFANILEHQETNGSLKKGNVYSYLEMIKLLEGRNYLKGYTSTYDAVIGGGVCAGATVLSNAFYEMAGNLGVDYDDTYQPPKFSHPAFYPLGPFAPDTSITDTTVQINNDGSSFDYRMIPPKDLYINVSAVAIPNGVSYSETNPDGMYVVNDHGTFLRSDVQFALNISLTTDRPTVKAKDLRDMRQQLMNYRSTNHTGATNLISRNCLYDGDYYLDAVSEGEIAIQIYPDQDTRLFTSEISRNQYLKDIFSLQAILNQLTDADTVDVAAFFRKSGWYQDKLNRGEISTILEAAIRQLNAVRISGQPVQCVAWEQLIASLPYSDAPISIGGVDIRGPIDLIPNSILTYPDLQTSSSPTGGTLRANRYMQISDYQSGDVFLINNPPVGHVGAILSKKYADGKWSLLATESNRHNDGRIEVFTIDEHNFNAKLGMPPKKKIILRR